MEKQVSGISQPWGWVHDGLTELLGRVGKNHKTKLGLTELPWQDSISIIHLLWLFQWFPYPVLPKRPSIENPRDAKFGRGRRNNPNTNSSLSFPPNHCFPPTKPIQIQIWASPQSCYRSVVTDTELSKSTIIRNKPVDPEEFVPVPPWILVP